MRTTRQRVLVDGAIGAGTVFRSAQDVHFALIRQGERIGLTTVYRTLQAMADAGELDAVRNPAGEVVYRRCRRDDHHHHLVCRSCGLTIELSAAEVEEWAAKVARRHGFGDVRHTVEMFGYCRECKGNY